MSDSTIFVSNYQTRSKGGSQAAKNMTAEQKKERALKASHSRKCYKDIPRATHVGEILINDFAISCAVLEDGTRMITEKSMFQALGKAREGRKNKNDETVGQLPAFFNAKNLIPFIPNNLTDGGNPFIFLNPKSGKSYGHRAEFIPDICKVFLDAREANVLLPSQLPTAIRAQAIIQALAKTGIVALVDEATGYQRDREDDELQRLFSKFLAKEIQPWVKRFPAEFFENLKRMYGLEHLKGNPQFAGHIINKYIYEELSPEIHEELKRRNPITEKGYRSCKHHQLLTSELGCPALEKQIIKVNTLMSVSDSKEQFNELYLKTK